MLNLSDLNREQRQAAETLEGPLLVLAGAGSGKTKMLTYRVANLIEHGVAPYHIMAITFTNKAAAEMRERVSGLVGEDGKQVWVSTFHSACARILRRDIEKLGYTRSFVIYDDSDQDTVIKNILKKFNLDADMYPYREIKSVISHAKEKLLTPREWLMTSELGFRSQPIADVYAEYENQLKANNALDFNDLIVKTLELFALHPPVLQYYLHTIRYLHVDEYQDTDFAQYQLISQLAQEEHNLCVVGDDDQSIYSWRGADINNILNFQKDFPEAKVIKLERNYRSSSNILDAANQVIAGNVHRMDKSLWTEREAGEKIGLYEAQTDMEEAEYVAEKIGKLAGEGIPYSNIAILYRSNNQSRLLELKLAGAGIPFRIYGGLRFYDRKEIKDATSYMRLILNPTDDVSLRRIINVPKRGLGDSTVDALFAYAEKEGIPGLSACMSLPEDFSSRSKKKVEAFGALMMQLTMELETRKPTDFVRTMIDLTGLRSQYEKEKTPEDEERIKNLDELVSAVAEYEKANPDCTLQDFLETISLESSFDQVDESKGVVTMMTVHGAKGLEFPAVFMVGMMEGVFPSYYAINNENDPNVEEERRLCYVGITRAKDRLFLSYSRTRMFRGEVSDMETSRFLDDIPTRLIKDEYRDLGFRFGGRQKEPWHEMNDFSAESLWKTPEKRQGAMGTAKGWGNGNAVNLGGRTIPGVQRGFGTAQTARPQTQAAPAPQRPMETRSRGGNQVRVSSVASKARNTESYAIGNRVLHKTYGMGTVLGTGAKNNPRFLVIQFDNGTVKEMDTTVAPIIKMEE